MSSGRFSESHVIRTVVVEDHTITRIGLVTILSRHAEIKVVGEAASGSEACAVIDANNPDVVLIDLGLPDMSGLDVIIRTRNKSTTPHFIVLSIFEGSEDIYKSLRAGASGYLLKDCKPVELFSAIREVKKGRSYLQNDIVSVLAERHSFEELSERELDVIDSLVAGKSNKEIADGFRISENTVKQHIANIFEKMHVLSRSEVVTQALRRGIVHMKKR